MLDLPDDWVWDFWTLDAPASPDGRCHLFFLKAPRTLGDPELRHTHASVGHAVSSDLVTWQRLPDALGPQPVPAFDELATWTGSVALGDDGLWRMFTSGIAHDERERVQRIGVSTSPDLVAWTRVPGTVMDLDPRWYASDDRRGETHWRDPYVIRAPDGTWHAYITAKVPGVRGNGVVGHATSPDLRRWQVNPPLDVVRGEGPGRFDQLEVLSLACVEGRWVLLFSTLGAEVPGAAPGRGGVWSVPVEGPGAPVDTRRATRLTSEQLYVGRIVVDEHGVARFLAFRHQDAAGRFVGGIIDPVAVRWREDGDGLVLVDTAPGWAPASAPG